jgi:hypothetical protein
MDCCLTIIVAIYKKNPPQRLKNSHSTPLKQAQNLSKEICNLHKLTPQPCREISWCSKKFHSKFMIMVSLVGWLLKKNWEVAKNKEGKLMMISLKMILTKWPKVQPTTRKSVSGNFWGRFGWQLKKMKWWHAWKYLNLKSRLLLKRW